jgi:hypothetical protein
MVLPNGREWQCERRKAKSAVVENQKKRAKFQIDIFTETAKAIHSFCFIRVLKSLFCSGTALDHEHLSG